MIYSILGTSFVKFLWKHVYTYEDEVRAGSDLGLAIDQNLAVVVSLASS